MTFRVGQRVVCVDDGDVPGQSGLVWGLGEEIRRGAIYTVRSCHLDRKRLVLWLDEVRRCDEAVRHFGPLVGYCATRFRPVVDRPTDISIFTAMLDRAREREPA